MRKTSFHHIVSALTILAGGALFSACSQPPTQITQLMQTRLQIRPPLTPQPIQFIARKANPFIPHPTWLPLWRKVIQLLRICLQMNWPFHHQQRLRLQSQEHALGMTNLSSSVQRSWTKQLPSHGWATTKWRNMLFPQELYLIRQMAWTIRQFVLTTPQAA